MVNILSVNAEYAGDASSIPGSGRYLGKEMATHANFLARQIPWTEEPEVAKSWTGLGLSN